MMRIFLDTWYAFQVTIEQTPSVVMIVAGAGLIVAISTEHLQMVAKYKGALDGKIARGYHNAMKLLVFNRVGAVLYFLTFAIMIDLRFDITRVQNALGIAVFFQAALSFLVSVRLSVNLRESLDGEIVSLEGKGKRVVFYSFLATLFNLCGLTIPMLLGGYFPEFRLTLANFSFLFNTMFTVVNVFLIESYVAKMLDENTVGIGHFVRLVFLARSLSAVVVSLGLLLLN